MFSHVFAGVDGRAAGRDAVALARQLAAPDTPSALVNVYALTPAGGASHAYGAMLRDESTRVLEQERAATVATGELISVTASSVGRGLHSLAETDGADLIVVGSCCRGFAGRVLVGSDTRDALNGARCAVAVAPIDYAQDAGEIVTIGVGYDGSPESEAALALARRLAAQHHASLRALHVVTIPTAPYAGYAGVALPDLVETTLAEAKDKMAALEGVEGEAVTGTVGHELAAFAAGVDLLVVGSRSYGPLRRLVLGSTAHHLTAHAPCPVLVLPRGASAARDLQPRENRVPVSGHGTR